MKKLKTQENSRFSIFVEVFENGKNLNKMLNLLRKFKIDIKWARSIEKKIKTCRNLSLVVTNWARQG